MADLAVQIDSGALSGPSRLPGAGALPVRPLAAVLALVLAMHGSAAWAQDDASAEQVKQLQGLSIEDLAKLDISSVTKTSQPLNQAPAAVYVITHDDIIRSGSRSIPEILRLAPNLQVAQVTASSWSISARGFNGSAADKLLVLVDGRSVYATFFSGVFWDVQDIPPEDIERIEVVSGPGATLWGANAVNGVINIITRSSADTQGGVVSGSGGAFDRRGMGQIGGRLGQELTYRLYVTGLDDTDDVTSSGANGHDAWHKVQGGFRADWRHADDLVTLQGDAYGGSEDQATSPAEQVAGNNLVARWTHTGAQGSALQVQLYYDYISREIPGDAEDRVHTYDLDVQDSFSLGRAHQIVVGGGYRMAQDHFPIVPNNPFTAPLTQMFDPVGRTLNLGDAFAQDTISLSPALKATLGVKLEDDPYSGLAALPSLRLGWTLDQANFLWAAVSRAIRAPSRLDEDFIETLGPVVELHGGVFQPETLVAYEVGYRAQPSARLSASLSGFYNVYSNLRSFDLTAGGLPITIGNQMEGETYGLEFWGAYQATAWWRLTAGANWLHEDLRFKPGSVSIGGIASAGDDPDYQLSLRSAMDLPHGITLDLDLRRVGALPSPATAAYTELGGRIGWPVTRNVELSLSGANLLHAHHLEFGDGAASVQLGATGVESERSVSLGARWRF